ncbi:amidohydrolase family protein [Micromonospora sp. RHAY321]|uniref:amidohydrolase family protein n=1 Tax=Micromonospora sp. RHAY321 TaxID=2944807 RepID=UPI00207D2936|nr:amidohydrolase family protein [Micromonospora sp. RHAY321]MCO1594460.1 amidohydrolase family protein [Micromonospora sp. RHAY321]
MIVDAHHHLWDPAVRAYPWLSDDALAPIRRPFTLADLRAAADERVAATVVVQTVPSVAETEEFLTTARESGGLIAGVVGWLDLTRADTGDEIDRLRSGPLVGVRHQAQDEPDPDWLRRADVTRGIAAVGARGLPYDILVRAPQRPAALAAAQGLDGVRFVIDHAGKPGIAAGEWGSWASWITAMARCEGVVCKLSGLVTEAAGDWSAARIRPYAEHVLSAFGADRVLFGSDWPVCELHGRYADVLALTDDLLAGCTTSERAAVLGDTARRVYALP